MFQENYRCGIAMVCIMEQNYVQRLYRVQALTIRHDRGAGSSGARTPFSVCLRILGGKFLVTQLQLFWWKQRSNLLQTAGCLKLLRASKLMKFHQQNGSINPNLFPFGMQWNLLVSPIIEILCARVTDSGYYTDFYHFVICGIHSITEFTALSLDY